MCVAANKAAREINPKICLLAVTVLTSLNDKDVKEISNFESTQEQIKNLAMKKKIEFFLVNNKIVSLK